MQLKTTAIFAAAICLLLSACGQQESGKPDVASPSTASAVGPQYQQPTMDNLAGKPQQFPAAYPLSQYPRSKVSLAWVQPHLQPGWKNQVLLKSEDPPRAIAQYYGAELKNKGWKPVFHWQNLDGTFDRTVWQKDGQEIEVRVQPDLAHGKGQNDVQLLCGPQGRQWHPTQTK